MSGQIRVGWWYSWTGDLRYAGRLVQWDQDRGIGVLEYGPHKAYIPEDKLRQMHAHSPGFSTVPG